jgi:hypothetical protein
VRLEGLGQMKNIHLIGNRTRDLPGCSIVPQSTTLPLAPECITIRINTQGKEEFGKSSAHCDFLLKSKRKYCKIYNSRRGYQDTRQHKMAQVIK